MLRTAFRRAVLGSVAAVALSVSGLPLLTGTAHAAGVTASPDTEPNSGSFTITFTGTNSLTFLATSVTLTDHSDSTNTFTAAATGTVSQPTKTNATFNLLNKLPSVYDISLDGMPGGAQTCTSTNGSPCFTITGVPPTLALNPPASMPVGGSANGSLTLVNPARGYKYSSPRVTFNMSGVVGLHANQLTLDVTLAGTTAAVALSDSGPDIVGSFGPPSVAVPPGVVLAGQLNFAVAPGAPTGKLHIDVAFGNMDNSGVIADPVASDAGDSQIIAGPTGSTYHPMTPVRVLDTRAGIGRSGAVGPLGSFSLVLGGTHNIPTSATAVALNLTATAGTGSGFLVAYPGGSQPVASNVNYLATAPSANLVVVPLNTTTHAVTIANGSTTATVHVVGDVVGYYGASGAVFTPLTPTRLLDTRTG